MIRGYSLKLLLLLVSSSSALFIDCLNEIVDVYEGDDLTFAGLPSSLSCHITLDVNSEPENNKHHKIVCVEQQGTLEGSSLTISNIRKQHQGWYNVFAGTELQRKCYLHVEVRRSTPWKWVTIGLAILLICVMSAIGLALRLKALALKSGHFLKKPNPIV